MKISFFAVLVVALSSTLSTSPGRADGFYDDTPMLRDVNDSNPGVELIMPRSTRFGADPLGNSLGKRYQFDIYPAGSTSRLYSSTIRSFSRPTPCSDPQPFDWYQEDGKLFALPNSRRTDLVETVIIGCTEKSGGPRKNGYAIFVYSADVSGPDGTVWSKTFSSSEDLYLDSIQGVDTNNDGTPDALALIMSHIVSNGYNKRVVMLDEATGTTISSRDYPTSR